MLSITPGALVNLGEAVTLSATVPGTLTIRRHAACSDGHVLREGAITHAGVTWTPTDAGSYEVEYATAAETITRYIGVVAPGWAVCQLTIGAFSAEDFDEVVHTARVPVDYYVTLNQASEARWVNYERCFGDAIHPHVHANSLGMISPDLAHEDPNWETLPLPEITRRLCALQTWWTSLGYQPLDRIASYTPCNRFVDGCREAHIRILHSIIPEQNWSDGEWAINHWGMPTAPFWVARDDFRKPEAYAPDGVLAMTMNHYQVLLPHLTHWGDFVLSPSHTLRWHRSSETGANPVRFEQFARDTVSNAVENRDYPVFFVAGFEFGRTFGVANMTDHNRRGLERLIDIARSQPVVFAASRDVLAYYERHIPVFAERVLHQRDTWAGARTMGKPGVVGDAIVIERADYKALLREGEALPWFHYDYTMPWSYPTAAIDVPEDWTAADRHALSVTRDERQLRIVATAPLTRAIPVALWDAMPLDAAPFTVTPVTVLDDERRHAVLEVPAGWQGEAVISLAALPVVPSDRPQWWQTKTLGVGERRHTYLHLDRPLLRDVTIPVALQRPAVVDGPQAVLGPVLSGELSLTFGPHRTWYRFWGVDGADIAPTAATAHAVQSLVAGVDVLDPSWSAQIDEHLRELHAAMLTQTGWREEQVLLAVGCGARLPLGSRSRAVDYDDVQTQIAGLTAHEYGDGALAYGPGKSFWVHPRGLSVKVHGLQEALCQHRTLRLVLHSFDPCALGARYKVAIARRPQPDWALPTDPWEAAAWYSVTIDPSWIRPDGTLTFSCKADQQAVLADWWADRGFVAGIHALWIGVENR
ncbi:MAG TPA: hypothetical protein VGL77_04825 [Armatimonadota bacterium]|jgi:hypothetical protein